MDAEQWDERYAASDLVWSAEPNHFVVTLVDDLTPGTAIDVAAGEGRNALWLAEQGWAVTAVDFSSVAVERGRVRPGGDGVDWQVADITTYAPDDRFDLVLLCYLHLPRQLMRRVLNHAASWVAPDGHLVVIGHAVRNLNEGVGGPDDVDRLQDEELYAEAAANLVVERLEEVERDTPNGTAIDVVLRARHV
ncbi:MAG: class I SAM-dependent methyltransferase [Jiangellales bacterium]